MFETNSIQIIRLDSAYRDWACRLLEQEWEDTIVVTRGRPIDAAKLPGFVALRGDRPVGLTTYQIEHSSCEIVSLNSLQPRLGIGSSLVMAIREVAIAAKCDRLWLITTNDNLRALRFYQQRGFALTALHKNAISYSRQIKPSIPQVGLDRIPIRDEIELEMFLSTGAEKPAISGFHHIQIKIPNGKGEVARDFYCKLLGLTEIETPDNQKSLHGFWVRIGDLKLQIQVISDMAETTTNSRLAFYVTNLRDWRGRLGKEGIMFEELTLIPGRDYIRFRDPFGNWIEFLEVT